MKMQKVKSLLSRFHSDTRGAEGLEKLLIIAAITLPLLGLLLFLRDNIKEWVQSAWDEQEDAKDFDPEF